VAWEIRAVRKAYGPETPIGRRRTTFADAPEIAIVDFAEAMVEREPVTVIVSEKGWIRAMKGHVADLAKVEFKGDDRLKTSFFAETTSKILVLATTGKLYTLEAAKLPGGRGFGDPIRLMADLDDGADVVTAFVHKPGTRILMLSSDGRGFITASDDLLANTRKGRGVLGIDAPARAMLALEVTGDHVAIVGENRKLLVFPVSQLPDMTRGKGVRLQRYKDGGVSDAKTFNLADGLTWRDASGRTWTVTPSDLAEWVSNRAEAGRLPPKGFPKTNKFA
jgi:topoisomerase-4 subunit A